MYCNYLEKLEFYKILNNLSNFCCTNNAKKIALELTPKHKKNEVETLLQETEEAINLSIKNGYPTFYEIDDITIDLKKLESNSFLSAKSLLNLAHLLKLGEELKNYIKKDYLDLSKYPILSKLFLGLYTNKNITNKILSCILDDNTIDDKASLNLQSIRKQQKKLEQDIRTKLNTILHSASVSKYIQENIITIRNERFVIPVKEEHRSQIQGFIHDVSHAGSTIFVEPLSIFDMNNELNNLKKEENLEIEKILQDFSALFYPYTKELEMNSNLISILDFIFAKAKFSTSIKGTCPIINEKKEIHLKNAKHPLIDKNKVVPISLDLGENFSILLITRTKYWRKNSYSKNSRITNLYGM